MISIIFGAGASYGSGGCSPTNPPLGNNLFSELEKLKGAYYKLNNDSKSVFKTEGFEAGMATVADDSRVINPLQKELACYLSSFSIKSDNAYVRLFNKLRACLDQINIVTLNYDLLIEQSLANRGFGIDYNANGNGINLLKPHGSSNFLPQIPKGTTISGNIMIGGGSFVEGLETQAVSNVDEVRKWCHDSRNSDLSPVLAMYAEGKRVVVNRNLIINTQQKYSEIVASSKLVILVGIKYIPNDKHIWEPIEKARPNVLIADPYPQSTIDWAKDKNITSVTIIEKGFDKSVWDLTKGVHKALYFT
ncbi:hypothetical protein [Methylomonas methanica]|uniref:SIR2-like domain-containing protein n=1 Tax=Methylomonas methanica (strain DSM 25384 / MC09) TaxID=857087 RepID=G0A733_METMM|nr:hypothetical protein [Methylomonas methanica]AEG01827.1 hypothetical protein Metme_3459 [Methylomonas methanica MC09]